MQQFDMSLNQMELKTFRTKKGWSTVLNENIPQLSIQVLFIILIQDNETNYQIVFIAMAISVLSSIFSTTSQRKIIRSTDYVTIEFDVTNAKRYRMCKSGK